jgi:hypothetical protein
MSVTKKAVFVGSLQEGFELTHIVGPFYDRSVARYYAKEESAIKRREHQSGDWVKLEYPPRRETK